MLSKNKENKDKEFVPDYFNSATKTVITSNKCDTDKYFQEMLYRIDNWINEGSVWVVESIKAEYVNISVYSPSSVSAYIELSHKLKSSKKGLIITKNNGKKCFLWCHIRHLNPLKAHLEIITKAHKK